ncbi:septum formation protein [Aliiroseovarius halocynthiae]|uniref:dTTP/UTP pyrophosphatase n=1 Tax=Aliiroseovarius halocynthiae TaxID=985055 RepID=A0A545SMK0_9RHOB|nr:Maf family protein [Aliiroseovarius halocynthiae]TQV66184.1 septum formation protein Maf [Aliiroseovarius halocynthiae]SMR82702.1 septum formation protein [Aliiroseovarius halocynthiae]
MTRPKLILGSGSPRRAELLGQLGLVADDIRPPDVDETPKKGELPLNYCRRIAASKAAAMHVATDEVVLCADTTVALGRRIMGKPKDTAEAAEFLMSLSGRRHRVITSVVVRNAAGAWARDVVTNVKMKRLSNEELNGYLATGDWQGKAGGYAIQGPAGAFIPWIQGSYTGVVGLPIAETAGLLQAAGFPLYGEQP